MSRDEIRRLLALAAHGEVAQATRLLRSLPDQAEVRRRLDKAAQKNAPAARELLQDLFPAEAPAAPPAVRDLPPRVELSNPGAFLSLVCDPSCQAVRLDAAFILQSWAVVGMAALARRERPTRLVTLETVPSPALDFARALGLHDVVEGRAPPAQIETERTVRLQRLSPREPYEPLAHRIAALIAPHNEDARTTLYYVLVELLRNAQQHSLDPLGAVVGAQRMTADQKYAREVVQVTVADAGIGILAALRGLHPDLTEPAAALEKALRPHISGTFEEGMTGSDRNAGFGLFVISELTKLTGGRLLIASRGAALLIRADPAAPEQHRADLIGPIGCGFPGTLVCFEFPVDDVPRFDGLMEEIKNRAARQTPKRAVHRWIRYENIPPEAQPVLVRLAVEDVGKAELVAKSLRNNLLGGDPLLLDFDGLTFVTQSFLHALLFRVLRLAWAEQHPVYVRNAAPAVKSAIETFEQYALGG